MKNKKIKTCLCGVCANEFYNIPGIWIKHKETFQKTRNVCPNCNTILVNDYFIGCIDANMQTTKFEAIRILVGGSSNE